jgi:histidinol dehydrogenase
MSLPILEFAALDQAGRRAALARPSTANRDDITARVRETIARVRTEGDPALLDYAARFDGGAPVNLRVPKSEIDDAIARVGNDAIAALRRAIDNVRRFHQAQIAPPLSIETSPGVRCERIFRPIDSVGLYVPGGSAPLPSALIMSAVPADLAGCERRIVCSPGTKAGRIDPVILATARLCGIDDIFAIGGAQAIAAMAYGTATIPKVDKIFGPGSAWVTAAKQCVAADPEGAALDLPAGPSEVLVIADETADPSFVAADLLAQAEHDPLSQAILLTTSRALAEEVRVRALDYRRVLSRVDILEQSLSRSRIIVVASLDEAITLSNAYAPEHLILQVENPRRWMEMIRAAGSVFLGAWSPEPMGDYCSGTNHVLPTYGYARAYSGLSVADFQRRITVQELTQDGLRDLGPTASTLARLEGLDAHALAVDLRLAALSTSGVADQSMSADVDIVRTLARPSILALRAYEHAHWDARFERLHANESPWPPPTDTEAERLALHRYPEPQPPALVKALAETYHVAPNQLLVTRGSDEGIDLLTRAFCESDRDAVIVCPPTFGMYGVAASTQGATVLNAPLTTDFQLDVPKLRGLIDGGAKILWICSPNNPTGNLLRSADIDSLLEYSKARCLVVIDEAYAEFAEAPSWISRLDTFPHLVVLRTLSKAYGLAGARIGSVIAQPPIIALLRKIVPPYAIASASMDEALKVLQPSSSAVIASRIQTTLQERERMACALRTSPFIKKVFPSDTNFLLVQPFESSVIVQRLRSIGILVRDFSGRGSMPEAVRITVGTPDQNDRIIDALSDEATGRASS